MIIEPEVVMISSEVRVSSHKSRDAFYCKFQGEGTATGISMSDDSLQGDCRHLLSLPMFEIFSLIRSYSLLYLNIHISPIRSNYRKSNSLQ